jgi:hypothetical protein
MDFSDALHLAQAGHCDHLAIFDARFRKLAERLKLDPPVLAVRAIGTSAGISTLSGWVALRSTHPLSLRLPDVRAMICHQCHHLPGMLSTCQP